MASRRKFIKSTASIGLAAMAAPLIPDFTGLPRKESLLIIGPRKGYTPYVGTLLSTMDLMRQWVIDSVKGMSQKELDFQLDEESNSIGAMLYHLAATEKYYQLNTFDGMEWDSWDDSVKAKWDLPMNLGEEGREKIVGHDIDFYLGELEEVRDFTKKQFAKKDDEWLLSVDDGFPWGPTNNYCKWFHVCEHESNHRGQIKFIAKRIKI